MTEVVFSDPPPVRGRQTKYDAVYDAARARPGKWAEFPGQPRSPSSRRYREGFRFTYRKTGPGERKVWVVYCPELDTTR